jgi:hypothetical protein
VVDGERHAARVVDGERHAARVVDGERHAARVVDGERHAARVVDAGQGVTEATTGPAMERALASAQQEASALRATNARLSQQLRVERQARVMGYVPRGPGAITEEAPTHAPAVAKVTRREEAAGEAAPAAAQRGERGGRQQVLATETAVAAQAAAARVEAAAAAAAAAALRTRNTRLLEQAALKRTATPTRAQEWLVGRAAADTLAQLSGERWFDPLATAQRELARMRARLATTSASPAVRSAAAGVQAAGGGTVDAPRSREPREGWRARWQRESEQRGENRHPGALQERSVNVPPPTGTSPRKAFVGASRARASISMLVR